MLCKSCKDFADQIVSQVVKTFVMLFHFISGHHTVTHKTCIYSLTTVINKVLNPICCMLAQKHKEQETLIQCTEDGCRVLVSAVIGTYDRTFDRWLLRLRRA